MKPELRKIDSSFHKARIFKKLYPGLVSLWVVVTFVICYSNDDDDLDDDNLYSYHKYYLFIFIRN